MSNKIRIEDIPDHPIHPGITLKETLEHIGLTQAALARRMDRPLKTINEIINGKASITAETSVQLERVLGVSSDFWLNLEANYQMAKARVAEQERLQEESKIIVKFPYNEMAKHGWVKITRNSMEKTSELLNYFGVVSLKNVKAMHEVAFRKSKSRRISFESLAAWLRRGELVGRQNETQKYERAKYLEALVYIRDNILSSDDFSDQLFKKCAECGVAVSFVPHLRNTFVNGASRWLSPHKALIQLSILYRYQDIFWFSFFHEAAHILKHNKEEYINFQQSERTGIELDADKWARNFLIPEKEYLEFCDNYTFSRNNVRAFAGEINVPAGIVVGRLQHDEEIPHSHLNNLRVKLQWKEK